MVSPVWRMKPFAFKQMWEHFGHEYLPYPLGARPTSDTTDEHRYEQIDAIDEAITTLTEWYEPALVALTTPEVRVEIFGSRWGRLFRAHVGIRDGIACLATQEPGRDPDIGGEVTLRALNSVDVGKALAKTLDVNVSGTPREWRFTGASTGPDELAKERELDAVMARGLVATLPVGVLPGAMVDWRPDPDTKTFDIVTVRDHGDLIVNRAARQVVSATPERTAKAFDTYIAAVKQIYERHN
ncbi:ESX secretion-associated protein EspG [Gordonia sp. DT30]|uniref:ESX secretion-associated protein EspG n=1 Tax=unclassified Gordonia (in: high G+C Gram-positive bacteria) TaxID=2657482 RepID=UPI003CEFF9A6